MFGNGGVPLQLGHQALKDRTAVWARRGTRVRASKLRNSQSLWNLETALGRILVPKPSGHGCTSTPRPLACGSRVVKEASSRTASGALFCQGAYQPAATSSWGLSARSPLGPQVASFVEAEYGGGAGVQVAMVAGGVNAEEKSCKRSRGV